MRRRLQDASAPRPAGPALHVSPTRDSLAPRARGAVADRLCALRRSLRSSALSRRSRLHVGRATRVQPPQDRLVRRLERARRWLHDTDLLCPLAMQRELGGARSSGSHQEVAKQPAQLLCDPLHRGRGGARGIEAVVELERGTRSHRERKRIVRDLDAVDLAEREAPSRQRAPGRPGSSRTRSACRTGRLGRGRPSAGSRPVAHARARAPRGCTPAPLARACSAWPPAARSPPRAAC